MSTSGSVLVSVNIKDGYLVHEAYFNGCSRDSLHRIYSITKSTTSALIGLAIARGEIEGVHVPLADLLPQYADRFDQEKRAITLEHVLTLTSGLEWNEAGSYNSPENHHFHMENARDWMGYVLDRPMVDTPGERWVYNTGSVHLLSAVIKARTGQHAHEYARRHLLAPLGITSFEWNADRQGYRCTGGSNGGLSLTTRDTAKLGYLYLDKGRWQDRQVISADWVRRSLETRVQTSFGSGMGYLWWTGRFRLGKRYYPHVFAAGYGGQSIHIVPELKLMVVFSSWGRAEDADIFPATLMVYRSVLGREGMIPDLEEDWADLDAMWEEGQP